MADTCKECGMPLQWGDYYPFAACLMFKGCGGASQVEANLTVLKKQWFDLGVREGLEQARAGLSADGII